MNREILTEAVQRFILENTDVDSRKIALSKSPFDQVSSSELASQIESRKKTKKKLISWFNTALIYYPPAISIEQASSEVTALYKSKLIKKDDSLIDLTGGFGVDSFYFSNRAKQVVHCEINPQLSAIAEHNASQLGKENIQFIIGNGIDYFLNQNKKVFDVVYIDPSRRVNTKKVFKLDDCEPNIIQYQEQLFEKSKKIIIKTSPLLDISLSISQLKNVKEAHVISIKDECKELLFVLEKDFIGTADIHAVLLNENEQKFSFKEDEERNTPLIAGEPMNYLYDPDSALLKASCFKLIAERFGLNKLHLNTHLYTSINKIEDFPGRVFTIKELIDYKDFKKIKTKFSANVVAKNFPLNVDALRKKHRISESKDKYLFFCKTIGETLKVIVAERIY